MEDAQKFSYFSITLGEWIVQLFHKSKLRRILREIDKPREEAIAEARMSGFDESFIIDYAEKSRKRKAILAQIEACGYYD